jgi:translocation protein SEC62
MAAPQPSQEQMAQMRAQFEAEAARRGMTPQQLQALQQQEIMKEAAKHNVTPQQYVEMMRAKAMQEHLKQQQAQAQQGQQGQAKAPQQVQQQIPLNGSVEAKPEALALAKFLRKEDLKTRTCILEGVRRDMFRGEFRSTVTLLKSH